MYRLEMTQTSRVALVKNRTKIDSPGSICDTNEELCVAIGKLILVILLYHRRPYELT